MSHIEGDRNAVFVELLTQHQRKLYGFIYTIVSNASDAEDLLQETNIVLWSKNQEYKLGTNFLTWACQIAYFKVNNFLRTKGRSRLYFNEKLLAEISDIRLDRSEVHTIHSMLLVNCLGKLSSDSQKLLRLRYDGKSSILDVAKQMGRPVGSLYNSLSQIRRKLWECIRVAIKEEDFT